MDNDDKVMQVARAAHEMNRRWCELNGDDSQLAWEEAPEWQRTSAINGVRFHLANPDAGPAASHENWLLEKRREGWKWGPVKDTAAKEHPCYCPYDALPAVQRAKDAFFITVVKALAGGV